MSDINVATQWDENAEKYRASLDSNPGSLFSAALPTVVKALGEVKGKRVLDVGSGEGRFARAFHDLGAIVTGFDTASKMVDIARSLNHGRHIDYSTSREVLQQNFYDIVLCFMTMQCNPEDQALQLISSIYNTVKGSGLACFLSTNTAVLGDERIFPFAEPPSAQEKGTPYKFTRPTPLGDIVIYDHFYSPDHLKHMFAAHKFDLQREEVVAERFVLHICAKPHVQG